MVELTSAARVAQFPNGPSLSDRRRRRKMNRREAADHRVDIDGVQVHQHDERDTSVDEARDVRAKARHAAGMMDNPVPLDLLDPPPEAVRVGTAVVERHRRPHLLARGPCEEVLRVKRRVPLREIQDGREEGATRTQGEPEGSLAQ